MIAFATSPLWVAVTGSLALYLMSAARAALAKTAKNARAAMNKSTSFMTTDESLTMRATGDDECGGGRQKAFTLENLESLVFAFL